MGDAKKRRRAAKVRDVGRDTAGRKQAEQKLRESEEKYRSLVDGADEGILVAQDGILKFVNHRAAEFSGYSESELMARPFPEFIYPDDRRMVVRNYVKRMKGDPVPSRYEFRMLTADGSAKWVDMTLAGIEWDGKPAVLGFLADITGQKQTEKALRESEEKYRSLVDGANEAILVAQDGMLKFVNHKAAELSGYSETELLAKPFPEFIYPDDRALVVDNYVKRMKGEMAPSRYEFRLLFADGSARWVDINSVLIDWKGKPASLNFLTDITERKRLEKEKEKLQTQLLQAQKMEAIGTLAGGVAHDFNNLLTAISGYTTLAMGKIDESSAIHRDLKQVSIAATKASGVIRQLLLFSRKQHMEPMPMDPNVAVSRLLKMIDRIIGEDIVIETDLAKDVWKILGDEGNIEQVLMNLSVNARDAMPSGGKLFIKTENVTIDEEYCRNCHGSRPGRFVCISVSDTGAGMDELILEHIFEPFFTTKPEGKGTGLGLSVVLGIVQQHNGWINVYSEPGRGATFKVYFPASSDTTGQRSKEDAPLALLQGKGERIMVVEDQAEVRELAKEMLLTNGYSVFPVSSAKEAMDLFEKENGKFDLVFSDVILTGTTGMALVEKLLKRWKFGVIITSGYTDEKAHWDFIKENNHRFLPKPYTVHDLLLAVREVLNK